MNLAWLLKSSTIWMALMLSGAVTASVLLFSGGGLPSLRKRQAELISHKTSLYSLSKHNRAIETELAAWATGTLNLWRPSSVAWATTGPAKRCTSSATHLRRRANSAKIKCSRWPRLQAMSFCMLGRRGWRGCALTGLCGLRGCVQGGMALGPMDYS